MKKNELRMTFDPATIEHLGIRMYSTLPPVLSELIANAHDADAGRVEIYLKDKGNKKEIAVNDNGDGMSFGDINKKFLRIGRNRRDEEGHQTTAKGRKIIGKKGIGKLSFFGIAQEIEVITRKGGKENAFVMRWKDIKSCSDREYRPKILRKNVKCSPDLHGTTFTLRGVKRESDFDPDGLAITLSKIFIVDEKFQVTVWRNSSDPIVVLNERKYEELEKEVEWNVPGDIKFTSEYKRRKEITGHLIATEKPIPPKTNMRGVTLFSRKKLVNEPEYFSESTSSHFFSYLTGWLEVDFIDNIKEDVIATDRKTLRWGHPEISELRDYLRQLMNWLEQDWRKKRAEARERELSRKTGINISEWFSKVPDDIRAKIEPIVRAIVKDSELPEETSKQAIVSLHGIAPEYPLLHWRHLHPEIQRVSKQYYENEDYWHAATEAVKHYILTVRGKSSSKQINDQPLMGEVFGKDNGLLLVTANSDIVENDIEEGQKFLSMGVVSGFKNPVVSHSTIENIKSRGLFNEKDCLDILSLTSHLQQRLDKAKKRP